jgi:MFS family permease
LRRRLVLAVVGIAQLTVVLDATVVNIALPSAQGALRFSNGEREWIVTGYAVAFGSLLPLGGAGSSLVTRWHRPRAVITTSEQALPNA